MNKDKEVLFQLESSKTAILFGNILTTVGEVLKQKREGTPTALINYHMVVDDDGSNFKLTRQHNIVFSPQATQTASEGIDGEEGAGPAALALQASAAALLPTDAWETEFTTLVWSCTWKAKGLMPVRPQIIFKADGSIPAGEALMLNP